MCNRLQSVSLHVRPRLGTVGHQWSSMAMGRNTLRSPVYITVIYQRTASPVTGRARTRLARSAPRGIRKQLKTRPVFIMIWSIPCHVVETLSTIRQCFCRCSATTRDLLTLISVNLGLRSLGYSSTA